MTVIGRGVGRVVMAMLATLLLAAAPMPVMEAPDAALARDAAAYAALEGVDPDEALRRLRAQAETIPVTRALAAEFADRLAGIATEHHPWRIVVLLTGDSPVPPRFVPAGGMTVPILFRIGAPATQAALLAALMAHQAEIRASLSRPPGIGVDPRTGTLVVMVQVADAEREGADALRARLSMLAGVPVTLRIIARPDADAAMQDTPGASAPPLLPPSPSADALPPPSVPGGARVTGLGPTDGRRYVCTTGFTVTDGARDAIATAAHCPDALRYRAPDGREVALDFIGQWGWGYQDVQINTGTATFTPDFHADTAKTLLRPVLARMDRAGTRAGDMVCHRGERTGYSCALVELTDFAPAGDLCGGPCSPSWVTVAGPTCKAGDSGAPVFLGTTAYGIVKGGTYRPDGTCAFYFYMSLDYLPPGWALKMAEPAAVPG